MNTVRALAKQSSDVPVSEMGGLGNFSPVRSEAKDLQLQRPSFWASNSASLRLRFLKYKKRMIVVVMEYCGDQMRGYM